MTEKITQIIGEVLEVPVNAETSQTNCEKWDSLQHFNIIVALEDAFNLSFEPEDIAKMRSVNVIETVIKSHPNA